MVDSSIRIVTIASSLLLFFVVFELLRSGRLRAQFSLLWLAGAILVLLVGLLPGLSERLTDLLILVVIFVMVTQLVQTVTISKTTAQIRSLGQKIASVELRSQQSSLQIVPQILSTIAKLSPDCSLDVPYDPANAIDRTNALRHILKLAIECLGASSGSLVLLDTTGNPIEIVANFMG